jgi:MerR family transcriptional regulator, copper efflux regulator
MNIGQLAARTDLPAKTIRYYESIGRVPAASRKLNGYRSYDEQDVHRLRFIQRARSLGFSVAEVQGLLALWRNKTRASARVKAIALEKADEIDRKMGELKSMRRAILELVEHCSGNDRPECPILDELADAAPNALQS